MGEVVAFRTKKLAGFIPDLPEPFASNHAETRQELAGLIKTRNLAEPIYDDRACSEINPGEPA